MITITATAESITQAEQLLDSGCDMIYAGGQTYGLRLPYSFEKEELARLVSLVHEKGKKIIVPVTAIMHPEKMEHIVDYLKELESLSVDMIEVGDAGVIHLLKTQNINLPFIYNAQMMVTSERQINFWARRGACGAVLGREVPFAEMEILAKNVTIPVEILVYGATCIHQSLRPLVTNYKNYIKADHFSVDKEANLFLAEPKHEDTHHSIYEDEHGTHIFANNDLDLMLKLKDLYDIGLTTWKLEGLYTKGEDFVSIARLFVQAKEALEKGEWNEGLAQQLDNQLRQYHPIERGLDEGFFNYAPEDVQ